MISVALVHMLAHANEDLSKVMHGHFHWAFFMAGVGYGMSIKDIPPFLAM